VGGPVAAFPWRQWSHAKRSAGGRPGFLFALPKAKLNPELRGALEGHLKASGEGLQPLQAEVAGEQLLIFSALPPGQTLAAQLGQNTLTPQATCKLGIAVARSLQRLHQHSLPHGAVRIDRVWIADDGRVFLLRDPAIDLDQQGRPAADEWLQSSEPAAHYAAPEFAETSARPDPVTDIYGLGCLLFRVLTGRPLVTASDWGEAIAQQGQVKHPALVRAIEQGSAGDPLLRVIAYATAKQRSSRFSTADQLAEALSAALPSAGQQSSAHSVNSPVPNSVQPAPKVDVAPIKQVDARSSPTRRRPNRRPTWWVVGCCVATMLAMAVIVMISGQSEPTTSSSPAATPPVAPEPPSNVLPTSEAVSPSGHADEPESSGYQLVDDERLLFAPPYPPPQNPLSLQLLPPGPGMLFSLRPDVLLDADEPLVQALEPELMKVIVRFEKRIGMPLTSVHRLTIAVHPGRTSGIETSLAVELTEAVTLVAITGSLQLTPSRTQSGRTLYAGDGAEGDAYFFPAAEQANTGVTRFAIGPPQRIAEVADLQGAAIVLPRNLEALWKHASDQTDLAVLTTPNFLLADAQALLQESIPEAIVPLKSVLIPDVSSMLLVVAFAEQRAFAEVRCLPAGGLHEARLVRQLGQVVDRWPGWADQFVIESAPEPSWRLLATRFPLMVRFVTDRVRYGTGDGAAIANLYLPRDVVPQLVLASTLALNTPSGGTAISTQPSSRSLTLEEMLQRPMSVSFDQESLEFAIQTVVEQFQQSLPEGSELPPVRIVGSDLQKMGITQNQQIRNFARVDTTLRNVLTDLLVEANPDRTAVGPGDPKQSLVWVIAGDPDRSSEQAILITTRQAATGRYELPSEFRTQR